eukprot:scaffold977_cov253-Pinguiococcus_pyrenoidosus.AAC.34
MASNARRSVSFSPRSHATAAASSGVCQYTCATARAARIEHRWVPPNAASLGRLDHPGHGTVSPILRCLLLGHAQTLGHQVGAHADFDLHLGEWALGGQLALLLGHVQHPLAPGLVALLGAEPVASGGARALEAQLQLSLVQLHERPRQRPENRD